MTWSMVDIKDEYVEKGLGTIQFSLGKLVSKERMSKRKQIQPSVASPPVPPVTSALIVI